MDGAPTVRAKKKKKQTPTQTCGPLFTVLRGDFGKSRVAGGLKLLGWARKNPQNPFGKKNTGSGERNPRDLGTPFQDRGGGGGGGGGTGGASRPFCGPQLGPRDPRGELRFGNEKKGSEKKPGSGGLDSIGGHPPPKTRGFCGSYSGNPQRGWGGKKPKGGPSPQKGGTRSVPWFFGGNVGAHGLWGGGIF